MVDFRAGIPPEWHIWLDHPLSAVPGCLIENHLLLDSHFGRHEAGQVYLEELGI